MINIFLVIILLSDMVIIYAINRIANKNTDKIRRHLDYILKEITNYDKYNNTINKMPIPSLYQESNIDKANRILHEIDRILYNEKLPRNLFINKYLLQKRDAHGRFKKVS
jgi:uncharacterized protein HemY